MIDVCFKEQKEKMKERKIDSQKKRAERFVLDLVLTKLGKQGLMEISETEEPDFILHSSVDYNIGVEVAKAYCDNDNFITIRAKIIENRIKKTLKSYNLYHSKNIQWDIQEERNKTYQVMIPPFYLNEIKNSDLDQIPQLFREWITKKMPEDSMFRCFDNYSQSTQVELIYIVGSVPVIKNGELEELSESHPLHTIIQKKNELLNNHFCVAHPDFKEWWLCLEVPEDSTLSACRYTIPSNYDNNYTRIFMVDINRFRVYEFRKS